MKKLYVIFVLFLVCFYVKGQNLRSDHVIDRNSGGFMEFQTKPETIESVYMADEWSSGKVLLKSGEEIANLPIRYDLKNNLLEIKTDAGIKVAGFTKLKGFEVDRIAEKQTFFNAAGLGIAELTGLVEELVKGKTSLYSKPYLEVLPSNYNAALNVGSKTDQFLKKEKLLLVQGNTVTDVTKSGKKILGLFGEQSKAVEQFVKENNLSYKNREDLRKIIARYNQLVNG